MAKTDTPKRIQRQCKVVTNDVGDEECHVEEDASTERTEIKPEEMNQDVQDSQMDCVIEVKGSTPTITVSWDKKNEKGEGDGDSEKRNVPRELTQTVPLADEMGSTDNTLRDGSETKMDQEIENIKDKQVGGKRKAHSNVENCPSKKTKFINDGFCLFVGNLNNSKTFDEVKESLGSYLGTKSLLFEDIRLDHSKKHAFVDLASEMDLTKALTLNGETILDKPVKIAKAKVKSEDQLKAKTPQDKKAARNARCLFLKNLPYSSTKEHIMKLFHKAIAVRFPANTEGPSQGMAFVEFQSESIAKKEKQKKQGAKIQNRVLIVDFVGETNAPKVTKTKDIDSNTESSSVTEKKADAPPNNILFVSNLSFNVKEEKLNKIFQNAVGIKMPQSKGKPKGFAFVEFGTVKDAEKALQSTKNIKICKRAISVQFFEVRETPKRTKIQSKTLIVTGLAEKTTAETLKSAFEGAQSARVPVDKETGVSKKFGFVEFESEKSCQAVKKAMEDCEIDGSKVHVAYARPKGERGPRQDARGGSVGRPGGQPAGRGAGRGRRGGSSKGGKGRGAGLPKKAKGVENKE